MTRHVTLTNPPYRAPEDTKSSVMTNNSAGSSSNNSGYLLAISSARSMYMVEARSGVNCFWLREPTIVMTTAATRGPTRPPARSFHVRKSLWGLESRLRRTSQAKPGMTQVGFVSLNASQYIEARPTRRTSPRPTWSARTSRSE